MAEELHASGWRQVLLVQPRRLDETHLRAKGIVELVRAESAGMERSGHELPERLEILELRLVRIVVMGGRVVHVRGQPHRVVDRRSLDETQDLGDLELTAARRAVALRERLRALLA